MKKILIILLVALSFNKISGQKQRWEEYRKPHNPYKWYTINFSTPFTIRTHAYTSIDVCFEKESSGYVWYEVDSLGNMLSSPFQNMTWMKVFPGGVRHRNEVNLLDSEMDVPVSFPTLPFGCEESLSGSPQIGVSQIINQFLSGYFKVPTDSIHE